MTEPLGPFLCQRPVQPGEVLSACPDCKHLKTMHSTRAASSGGSTCQHCLIDGLWSALTPLMAAINADGGTEVEPPEGSMIMDWEVGYLRDAYTRDPIQCSVCRGLLQSHSAVRYDRDGKPRHNALADCQPTAPGERQT